MTAKLTDMTAKLTDNKAAINEEPYKIDSIWVRDDHVLVLDSLDKKHVGVTIHQKDRRTTSLNMTVRQARGLIECIESRLNHLD